MRLTNLTLICATAAAMAIAGPVLAKNNKAGTAGGFCPPGLAKKNPACMPPGQYKKYMAGDFIPYDEWRRFQAFLEWQDHDLPRPERDHAYFYVDDRLLLLNRKTGQLMNVIESFGRLLND